MECAINHQRFFALTEDLSFDERGGEAIALILKNLPGILSFNLGPIDRRVAKPDLDAAGGRQPGCAYRPTTVGILGSSELKLSYVQSQKPIPDFVKACPSRQVVAADKKSETN